MYTLLLYFFLVPIIKNNNNTNYEDHFTSLVLWSCNQKFSFLVSVSDVNFWHSFLFDLWRYVYFLIFILTYKWRTEGFPLLVGLKTNPFRREIPWSVTVGIRAHVPIYRGCGSFSYLIKLFDFCHFVLGILEKPETVIYILFCVLVMYITNQLWV